MDLRFIRRFRQGNACPKTASEIILNEETTPFVLYHSQANEVVIFGDGDMVHAVASVFFICVDGTFSRCPRTHYQLVTCHAVCWSGFSFPFMFALLPDKKIRYVFNTLHVDRFDCTTKIQCQRLFLNGVDGIVRLRTRASQGSFSAGLFCEVLLLSQNTSNMAVCFKTGAVRTIHNE